MYTFITNLFILAIIKICYYFYHNSNRNFRYQEIDEIVKDTFSIIHYIITILLPLYYLIKTFILMIRYRELLNFDNFNLRFTVTVLT